METKQVEIRKVLGGFIAVEVKIDSWKKETRLEFVLFTFEELVEWLKFLDK